MRNPRTPIGIALSLVPRLNPRDIKGLAVDRNVPEPVRKQAQKFVKAPPAASAEPAMTDYYELLGVAPTASAAEIRQAYARLAREKHPDRFTDPAEKQRAQTAFQDITTAFNTLVNPRSRQEYDDARHKPQPRTPEEIARDAFERAQPLLEAGRLEEAVTLLRTAVHHAPDKAAYHAALGRALARVPAGGARGGPGPRAGDAARAPERRRASPSSPPCSRGRACGCARRRRWRRRCASPPATPRLARLAAELGLGQP